MKYLQLVTTPPLPRELRITLVYVGDTPLEVREAPFPAFRIRVWKRERGAVHFEVPAHILELRKSWLARELGESHSAARKPWSAVSYTDKARLAEELVLDSYLVHGICSNSEPTNVYVLPDSHVGE
jgi:hypothetical protein